MVITKILSFLVFPGKNAQSVREIKCTAVPVKSRLGEILQGIFLKSDTECKIPICFTPKDGNQENDFKDELENYIKRKTVKRGLSIAERLYSITTSKSGAGLLFIITGKNGKAERLLLSRFPAEPGILADDSKKGLKVEFIEKIFMKNATSYKAAIYEGNLLNGDLWKGKAIDKQTNPSFRELSDYWIRDFLLSEFLTTPKAGSRRLANVLKKTLGGAESLTIKEEIVASATLAKNLNGNTISVRSYCARYNFSKITRDAVLNNLPNAETSDHNFIFDYEEFKATTPFKVVELDSGAILMAETDKFSECIRTEEVKPRAAMVAEESPTYRFIAEGKVTNTKFRKR